MNAFYRVITSSLGLKYIMAITGFVLVGFVLGHMAGNLQVFGPPEWINAYGHKLHNMPYGLLWVVRAILLATVVAHVAAAIMLTKRNREARPERYVEEDTVQASLASRTMPISGMILLAFIIFHLLHFTVQNVPGHEYGEAIKLANGSVYAADVPLTKDGKQVIKNGEAVMTHDVHTMLIAGFSFWYIALFYIVGMGLLCMHLSHGVSSMFQSLGVRNEEWRYRLNHFAYLYGFVVFAGFVSIPIAVLLGLVKPQGIELEAAPTAEEAVHESNDVEAVAPEVSVISEINLPSSIANGTLFDNYNS